jgi:O-methyltransferase
LSAFKGKADINGGRTMARNRHAATGLERHNASC